MTVNRIVRLMTTALVSAGIGVASVALAAAPALAEGPSYTGGNCPYGLTCTHWCPGDPLIPGSQVISWDWNVCHDWYWNSDGVVDVATNTIYPWDFSGPRPAPPPPTFR